MWLLFEVPRVLEAEARELQDKKIEFVLVGLGGFLDSCLGFASRIMEIILNR